MSSLVSAGVRSVAGKITRSALETRTSRPPASTMTSELATRAGMLRASVALVARRWALLRAERRREGRGIGLEARFPRIGRRFESGQAVQAGLPAGRVARRGARRELVDQDQAGAVAVGMQLEAQRLLAPREGQPAGLGDLEHLPG